MRGFVAKFDSRRFFLERLFCAAGLAFLSTASLHALSSDNANEKSLPKSFVIKFKYSAKESGDIDAYINSIMTPAMIEFRNYWKNTKKVVIDSTRQDSGKSIVSTHYFKTESDLKEFWEAAKNVPGKVERETYGISREYTITTLFA